MHFANKIWNVARFVLMNINTDIEPGFDSYSEKQKKYLDELAEVTKEITDDMDNFRFYMASEKIYHYFWHTFADKIVEDQKSSVKDPANKDNGASQQLLGNILLICLKLLHPFMPFITEEIYSKLPLSQKTLLMVENWP